MRARSSSRRSTVLVAGAMLLNVIVLGTDVYLLSTRATTTEVDLDDALAEFRSHDDTSTTTSIAAAPGEPGPELVSIATTTTAPGGAPTAPSSGDAPPTTGPFSPPEAGVYQYRTTGRETASLLDAHHDYPADTYAVIRRTGGCGWLVHAEVVREHVDEKEMCSEPGRLTLGSVTRIVEFFGVKDGDRFACDPPLAQHATGAAEGATEATNYHTPNNRAAVHLVRTTLPGGQVTVGGVTVDVLRFRLDGTLSGAASGTSSETYTVVAATGLPVLLERSIDARGAAFGMNVDYRERANFELVSLTPAT